MSITDDLVKAGVSKESAKLAEYQFNFLKQTGVQSYVDSYASLVNETVIAARERLLAYYKDKIIFDEDQEFLEDEYIGDLLQDNLDAITRSFDRNFGQMIQDEEYTNLVFDSMISATDYKKQTTQEFAKQVIYTDQAKQHPQEKQSIFNRIKESVSSFFGKSKAKATTAQRDTTQKQTQKKQGIFSRAVSAIKSFFGRG